MHQNTLKNANVTRYVKKKEKNTLQHLRLGKLKFEIHNYWVFDELNGILVCSTRDST